MDRAWTEQLLARNRPGVRLVDKGLCHNFGKNLERKTKIKKCERGKILAGNACQSGANFLLRNFSIKITPKDGNYM